MCLAAIQFLVGVIPTIIFQAKNVQKNSLVNIAGVTYNHVNVVGTEDVKSCVAVMLKLKGLRQSSASYTVMCKQTKSDT